MLKKRMISKLRDEVMTVLVVLRCIVKVKCEESLCLLDKADFIRGTCAGAEILWSNLQC